VLPKNVLPRKDRIILSAIEIIDELGFQGLSTKELAAREGIAESALYRHYKSKDDIIVAALEYYTRFDGAIVNSARDKDIPAKEKIKYVITAWSEYHENYPALTAILCAYDTLRYYPVTQGIVKDVFSNRLEALTRIIAGGQDKGEISLFFSAGELAEIIVGLYRTEALIWRMSGYDFSLKTRIVNMLDKLLAKC